MRGPYLFFVHNFKVNKNKSQWSIRTTAIIINTCFLLHLLKVGVLDIVVGFGVI